MQPEGRRGQVPGRRRDSILLRALRHPRELLRPGRPGRHPAPNPRGGRRAGRRGGHAGGAPGGAEWLKEADVVVIPTRTTSRDIEPLMRMRKAVFKHSRAKIVYVMNGWNRFKASRDFMEWFDGLAGDQTVVTLPQSEAFVQAGAAGVSVVEFDRRGKAARATRALVDTVREAAGFPRE